MNHEQQRASAFNDEHDNNTVTPHLEPHIKYPVRTWCHPPLSWSTIGNETAVPNYIEDSRPLFPQPRRRYRKKYAERRPFPPTPHTPARFATHSDAGSALTTAQAPAPPFATDKSGSENTTHQYNEDHNNNNNNTAPYSTTRSRPPPWPIKPTPSSTSSITIPHPLPRPHTKISPVLSITNSCPPPWPNKYLNRNRYQHNKYISARTTTARRPPPWPNKNGAIPISFTSSHLPHWPNHTIYQPTTSTPPARPPPWPILPPNTLQNYRNARRRLRKRS